MAQIMFFKGAKDASAFPFYCKGYFCLNMQNEGKKKGKVNGNDISDKHGRMSSSIIFKASTRCCR